MPLDKYKEKRKFDKTPEPKGGKASGKKLQFVIQKHAASHLQQPDQKSRMCENGDNKENEIPMVKSNSNSFRTEINCR